MTAGALSSSYAWCERVARQQAGNFYPAFRILPRPQRLAMSALYAYMRVTDDLADEPGEAGAQRSRLHEWRQQFRAAMNGKPSHPLHAALTDAVRRHEIPTQYFEDVIDGVETDLLPVRMPTFDELKRYCYRVASVVGLACIRIWGCRSETADGHAQEAGIAFQLTNILRDIGEDRARDRVYLPADDMMQFGCSVEQLGCVGEPAYRRLMAFEVERARKHYAASEPLRVLLPNPGRAVFQVMFNTYRGILDEIERRGYDVMSQRVSLSRSKKLGLVLKALPVRWGLMS